MTSDPAPQSSNRDVAVIIPLYGKVPRDLPDLVWDLQNEMVGEIIIGASAVADVPPLDGVTIIRAERRLTPSSAKNRAGYHATHRYLLFLDADNLVGQGAIGTMLDVLENGDAVIAAAATYYQEDRSRVAFYGANHRHWTGWTRFLRSAPGQLGSEAHRSTAVSIDVAANAYMMRRSDFIALGGFDEVAFPSHYEESDLSYRARNRSDKEVVCCLEARVYNDMPLNASERLGAKDSLRAYYNARSRAVFTARHLGTRAWWTYILVGQFAFGGLYIWSEMRGHGSPAGRLRSSLAYTQGMVDGLFLSCHELNASGRSAQRPAP